MGTVGVTAATQEGTMAWQDSSHRGPRSRDPQRRGGSQSQRKLQPREDKPGGPGGSFLCCGTSW